MNNLKYIHENIIITSFREHCPDFPKGKLIRSESPDFILKTGPKHSIGIELTAMPHPSYEITGETLQFFLSEVNISITKKEKKLKKYRKTWAEAYWLVIYADTLGLNGLRLDGCFSQLRPNHFDAVFLFDLFGGRVWKTK